MNDMFVPRGFQKDCVLEGMPHFKETHGHLEYSIHCLLTFCSSSFKMLWESDKDRGDCEALWLLRTASSGAEVELRNVPSFACLILSQVIEWLQSVHFSLVVAKVFVCLLFVFWKSFRLAGKLLCSPGCPPALVFLLRLWRWYCWGLPLY